MARTLFNSVVEVTAEAVALISRVTIPQAKHQLLSHMEMFKEFSKWASKKEITEREHAWLSSQFGHNGEYAEALRDRIESVGLAAAMSFVATFFNQFGEQLANAATPEELEARRQGEAE